jgi:hypothetical protein
MERTVPVQPKYTVIASLPVVKHRVKKPLASALLLHLAEPGMVHSRIGWVKPVPHVVTN